MQTLRAIILTTTLLFSASAVHAQSLSAATVESLRDVSTCEPHWIVRAIHNTVSAFEWIHAMVQLETPIGSVKTNPPPQLKERGADYTVPQIVWGNAFEKPLPVAKRTPRYRIEGGGIGCWGPALPLRIVELTDMDADFMDGKAFRIYAAPVEVTQKNSITKPASLLRDVPPPYVYSALEFNTLRSRHQEFSSRFVPASPMWALQDLLQVMRPRPGDYHSSGYEQFTLSAFKDILVKVEETCTTSLMRPQSAKNPAPCCCSTACACCEACKAKAAKGMQHAPPLPSAFGSGSFGTFPACPDVTNPTYRQAIEAAPKAQKPCVPPPGLIPVAGLHPALARLETPELEAHCEKITHRGDTVILEGNVMLLVKKHAQPMRINAQRVVLNMTDGSYTVENTSRVVEPWGNKQVGPTVPY